MCSRLSIAGCFLGLLVSTAGAAPPPHDTGASARRAWAVTELVLDKHVEPCSRQEMLLGGVRALLKAADGEPPADLSRRVSAIATQDQFAALLQEIWPAGDTKQATADKFETSLLQGLLANVPGNPRLLPADQAKVLEQVSGNRYVGIGIQLAIAGDENLPQIINPFRNGPARRAGARPGDRIVDVDGKSTKDVPLSKVVEWLRGDEGTSVTIAVRQPKATEKRTLKLVRSKVPFDNVLGYRRSSEEDWSYRIDPTQPIAYVWVRGMNSGTLHALRQVESKLQSEGMRALVLDLRFSSGEGGLHAAELVADGLLDGGLMWRLRGQQQVKELRADRECLFRDWPLAVLVSDNNREDLAPEAVAAALQDNGRAVLVGERPAAPGPMNLLKALATGPRAPYRPVTSILHLPDNQGALVLQTGRLERAAAGKGWPVQPDHVVALSKEQREAVGEWMRQKELTELPAGKDDRPPEDPQLARAVALLQAALAKSERR